MSEQSWNAGQYDREMSFVSKFGEQVLSWLEAQPGERVLDLGCGTGDLADVMHKQGAAVIGLDASEAMIREARVKYPQLAFRCADGEAFRLEESVDAVFSNAALHWMKQPEKVIGCVWKALRPGGRFVAEFGARGNVETILRSVRELLEQEGIAVKARWPWFFPSLGEYTTLLERQGFEVLQAAAFARPTPLAGGRRGLARWLDAFAGSLFSGIQEERKRLMVEQIENSLRPLLFEPDRGWTADYRRLRIRAVKPGE